MSEHLKTYENAVTSHRTAEKIAQRHGFENVRSLAESLPENARVLDVGAGASPFGREVAGLRPDVTWVNFDYSYQDPRVVEEVSEAAPMNVEYVPGDATVLDQAFGEDSFDAVFSYWMMPHLSLDELEPAHEAARAMYQVAKPGAMISVGPTSHSIHRKTDALQTVKDESEQSAEEFADRTVEATKLGPMSAKAQRISNNAITPFFGTSLYMKKEGLSHKVYDPKSGEYINPYSRRGVRLAGELAVALAQYRRDQKTDMKQTEAASSHENVVRSRNRDLVQYKLFFGEEIGKLDERILDLGAGDSKFAEEIDQSSEHAAKVTKVDLDYLFTPPQNHERAVAASAASLPFVDNSFDTVVSSWMFLHLPREVSKSALNETLRVVKPGGRVLITPSLPGRVNHGPMSRNKRFDSIGFHRVMEITKPEDFEELSDNERDELLDRINKKVSMSPVMHRLSKKMMSTAIKLMGTNQLVPKDVARVIRNRK